MRLPPVDEVVEGFPAAAAVLVRAVLAGANGRRVPLYLVGGPVRDLLLGRALGEADLIVEAKWEVAEALARRAASPEARVTPHTRFGTVTLRTREASVDLASVRREHYAHDGALPSVEPGSLDEDLARRDFSVNALALPLSNAACARQKGVVDLHGGIADLTARKLRCLHPRSFHDDPTRALRAARLGPRLRFSLTPGTRASLRDALRDGAFGSVSGERLRREFVKLFDDAPLGLDPSRALALLADWHVLGALEPGLTLTRDAVTPLRRLGRLVAEPRWRRGRFRPWVAGLALWLAPLRADLRRRVLARFSVRGEVAKRVVAFPTARDGWLRALTRARGRGAIDAILKPLDEEALHALCASSPAPLGRRIARYASEDRPRRPPFSGEDLVELGFEGPAVGRALATLRATWLDGNVRDREEALALAQELLRRRARAKRR